MATPETQIETHFLGDLRASLVADLTAAGATVDPSASERSVAYLWFNFMQHKIAIRPRNVHWSRELLADSLSPDTRKGIGRIEATSMAGDNLNPFLSKRTASPLANDGSPLSDGMLLDWGIYHMHLGEPDPGAFFVKRSGPLLFVFLRADDLYLLAVEDHKSFADQELLEILYRNWRDVLEPYRAPGILGFEDDFASGLTEQDRVQLRNAGVSMGVAMSDGTFYMCPGGGVTSAKHGANAVDEANHLLRKVRLIEEHVRNHKDDIVEFLQPKLGPLSEIRLRLDPSSGRILESSMNIEIPLSVVGLRMNTAP